MADNNPYISVVIPVYGADGCLLELYNRLVSALGRISNTFEIIMVNDCSPDQSWPIITSLANKDHRIKGISLSRNFGQHYAITAGLDQVRGDWIIVMDCDLQDQPEEIVRLYHTANEGFDIVLGRRAQRKDSSWKKLSSIIFYRFFSYLTDTKQDGSIANFGIYHRKVINVVIRMRENLRFFPTMIKWVGFRATSIEVEHASRAEGKSGYSIKKLLRLAFDAIIAFSDKPLRLTIGLGLTMSAISFLYAIYIVIKAYYGSISIEGWPSLIVSIWFLSGIIIFIMGIMGIYISRIFDQAKKRPIYIIAEKAGYDKTGAHNSRIRKVRASRTKESLLGDNL